MIDRNNTQPLALFSFKATIKAFAKRANPLSSIHADLRATYEREMSDALGWKGKLGNRVLEGCYNGERERSYVLKLYEFNKARNVSGLFASLIAAEQSVLMLGDIADSRGRRKAWLETYVDGAKCPPRFVRDLGLFGQCGEVVAKSRDAWSRNREGAYFVAMSKLEWKAVDDMMREGRKASPPTVSHGERVEARQRLNGHNDPMPADLVDFGLVRL